MSSSTCSPAAIGRGKVRVPRHRQKPQSTTNAASRQARKDLARLEQQLTRLDDRSTALHEQMAAAASDHVRLVELQREIESITANKDELELAWLAAAQTPVIAARREANLGAMETALRQLVGDSR